MSKEATPITVQVVTFNTTLPYKEVVARLEGELNKAESPDTFARFLNAKSNKEWLSVLDKRAQGRDFQYFSELPYSKLMKYGDPEGQEKTGMIAYVFGNPVFAKEIIQHNPLAAYSIPPRFLVIEKPGGTTVTYHQPSSVMSEPQKKSDSALMEAVTGLDEKLEQLAKRITAV